MKKFETQCIVLYSQSDSRCRWVPSVNVCTFNQPCNGTKFARDISARRSSTLSTTRLITFHCFAASSFPIQPDYAIELSFKWIFLFNFRKFVSQFLLQDKSFVTFGECFFNFFRMPRMISPIPKKYGPSFLKFGPFFLKCGPSFLNWILQLIQPEVVYYNSQHNLQVQTQHEHYCFRSLELWSRFWNESTVPDFSSTSIGLQRPQMRNLTQTS